MLLINCAEDDFFLFFLWRSVDSSGHVRNEKSEYSQTIEQKAFIHNV